MASAKAKDIGFTAQINRDINGQSTEFVFQRFANRWFLLITQYGKVANLYHVRFDVHREETLPSGQQPVNDPELHVSVPVTIKCNFGADKDEIRSGIQFLINQSNLNKCPNEDMLVSLGLKEVNSKNLRAIADVLNEIIT